jgi:cell division control protein 6
MNMLESIYSFPLSKFLWMVNEIIADPDVLEEDYIPESIPCREAQKKELAFCLSLIERGVKPLDCLCHGKPGTGKTALVKYVFQQIQENTNALALYINCWENKTLSSILDRIVEQLGLVIVEKSHCVKLTRVKRKIEDKPCVIALDEVDKLESKELNDAVYMLSNIDLFPSWYNNVQRERYGVHLPCNYQLSSI